MDQRQSKLLTSSIPEIGFIRVSVQRSTGRISVRQASHVLSGMLSQLGQIHEFLADDLSGREWPPWCDSAPKTTDAHLYLLAKKHKVNLATLDTGIPGAFLIPEID
jgi:predicted nucleic acid-binding protein